MAYDSKIEETEQEPFAELYEFRLGEKVNYYTSYRKNVLYNGNNYVSRPINRTNFKFEEKLRSVRVTVAAPLDPMGLQYVANAPIERLLVKITRVFLDGSEDHRKLFEGEVISVTIKDFVAQAEVESSMSALRNKVPRVIYQPRCNWMVFDSGCGLSEVDYRLTATVTVDGSDLVSAAFATKPDGYFRWGHVEKLGDHRWITEHIGNRVTLHVPFDSRVYDGAVVYAYPGCIGAPDVCQSKFSNFLKYLGMPYIPSSNPVIWGLKN